MGTGTEFPNPIFPTDNNLQIIPDMNFSLIEYQRIVYFLVIFRRKARTNFVTSLSQPERARTVQSRYQGKKQTPTNASPSQQCHPAKLPTRLSILGVAFYTLDSVVPTILATCPRLSQDPTSARVQPSSVMIKCFAMTCVRTVLSRAIVVVDEQAVCVVGYSH